MVFIKGIGYWTGKKRRPFSEEHKRKISEALRGDKSPHWKGGITPIHRVLRASTRYKQWRKSVFERDGYTCIWCGQRGGQLNADHIKPIATYPELIFELSNGRTLCIDCHKKTDNYAGRGRLK